MAENWDLKVGSVVFAYNTSVHNSTGHTPFQLMYGRVPTFPVDLVFPLPESGGQSLHSYVEDRVELIQRAHQRMREIQQNVAQRSARLYNPRDAQRLKVGMRVWYFTPRVWGPGIRKLRSSWGGPYRIIREIAPALFAIKAEPDGREIVAGSDSLRIYHESRTGEPDEAPGVQMDDGGDEYGELLGLPEEEEERGTGGPRYEPGEEEAEEERGSRGQERPQPQHTIVQVPQPRPVIIQVPQPGPVITQAPRATRKKQPKVGVSRGEQTDPVLQSRGQQADTPPVAPHPEMIVTTPREAPAESRRKENRWKRERRRQLDRRARAEEARAA